MEVLLNSLLVVGSFFFMEGAAWFTHKYIMHGFLWVWHRSHHRVHPHPLERNDLFALVFSVPSMALIIMGYEFPVIGFVKFIGYGILVYGLFYFIFHDIIVHRRIKIKLKTTNHYLRRIINAHHIHHEKHTKEGGEAFGFLYASKKYNVRVKRNRTG